MFRKILVVTMAAAVLLGTAGCVSEREHVIGAEQITFDEEAKDIEDVELDADYREAVTDYAIELFKRSNSVDGNTLVSPVSVMLALGMTANGADGETLKAFEEVLGKGMSIDEINAYYKSYVDSLPNTEESKLTIANSIWIKNLTDLDVSSDFLRTNKNYYNSHIYKTDFNKETVDDINKWVSDNTDGMIEIIINEIPSETLMMLINAIAFDAEWVDVYEEDQVRDTDFTKADGSIQSVEGMYGSENVYIEDEDTTGFIKEYKNGYSFVALLPDEGISIEDYVADMTGEKYRALMDNKQSVLTHTMIPKFKYEYSVEMDEILKDMGIKDAFSSKAADFSNMAGYEGGNIYIGKVLHKTFIEMGEKGTRAAAVTAVMMDCGTAMPEEYKEVYLDRPFVYMIVDNETNTPIFIGTVTEI